MSVVARPAVPASRRPATPVGAPTAATAPVARVKARGADPLPRFASSDAHKT